MRRFLTLALSCIAIATVAVAQNLEFKVTEHNFGSLERKSRTAATFYYSNTTDKPLVIVDTKTNCGCTKATYSKRPLPPGGTDSLTITFDAKTEGAFFKKVDVITNMGSQTLSVRGVVK